MGVAYLRLMLFSLLCSLLLQGAGCTRAGESKNEVRIGVSTLRISLPVFVAVERGLFAKRGLNVKLQRFDTAQPLADELATGRLDAGGYVAYPILFAASPPPPVRVVTAIVEDATHPLSYMLTKKGSGLKGIASLKGKKIGILPTIAYRRWLEAILKHDGIEPTDVTIVPTAPPLQIDSLSSGGIDALFTGDPMATAALRRGVAEPMTTSPDVPRVLGDPFLFGTFAVTDAFAKAQPEAARALKEALDEAISLIMADPAIGRAAMSGYVREPERAFVEHYPNARYLRSSEVDAAKLDRALELVGTSARAASVALP